MNEKCIKPRQASIGSSEVRSRRGEVLMSKGWIVAAYFEHTEQDSFCLCIHQGENQLQIQNIFNSPNMQMFTIQIEDLRYLRCRMPMLITNIGLLLQSQIVKQRKPYFFHQHYLNHHEELDIATAINRKPHLICFGVYNQ